uniref:B1065G12.6 protein n=1 Tax=Oryza sativa subsp. japonica TaxID=39947 RepID=Q7F1X8_ORYSJ|nr:B1065G12.6 [Oryza sativa Japonica Group]
MNVMILRRRTTSSSLLGRSGSECCRLLAGLPSLHPVAVGSRTGGRPPGPAYLSTSATASTPWSSWSLGVCGRSGTLGFRLRSLFGPSVVPRQRVIKDRAVHVQSPFRAGEELNFVNALTRTDLLNPDWPASSTRAWGPVVQLSCSRVVVTGQAPKHEDLPRVQPPVLTCRIDGHASWRGQVQATDSRVAGDDKPGQPPTRSGAAQLLVRVRACTPPAAGRPVGPPPPQLVAPSDCHVKLIVNSLGHHICMMGISDVGLTFPTNDGWVTRNSSSCRQ